MAKRKGTRIKPYQRVHKFPAAKGKIIAEVELSVSPDYRVIEIVFQDKTSLTFNLESCLQVTPEIVSWKSGSYKPLKRWRPVHSVEPDPPKGGFLLHQSSCYSFTMPSMFDPNLKLQWAKKHLDSLQSEIALFEQSQTCKVSTEEDIANGFYVIRVEFPDDPRQFAIALICGDFVNCLRSSLDHLAWQLALFTSNKPSRDICFPIIEKDSLDAQLRITRVTYGIPDEAVSVMKSFQPYHAGDNFKTSHLWRLNTLWNIDKHRHLAPHGVFTDWLYNTPPEALKVMRNEPLDYGYKVILPIAFKDQVKLNPNPSGARFYFGERPEGTETGVPDLVDMYEFVANTVLPAFTRFFK